MKNGSITFISAGAGSGKTTRLTSILYEKLLSGEARPDAILATTFTTKAAGELKDRVRAMLLHHKRDDLAAAIAESRIGTVNSVCGGLLKRFSFELGLTVDQRILDEKAALVQISRAIDIAVGVSHLERITALSRRLGVTNRQTGEPAWKEHVKAIIDEARYNGISAEHFEEFAVSNADELLAHFPAPLEEEPDEELLRSINLLKPAILEALTVKTQKNTASYLNELERFARCLQAGTCSWAEWLKIAEARPQKSLHDNVARVAGLSASVAAHPRLHQDIRAYLELVFSVAGMTLGVYQQLKHESGMIDFADQEAGLLDALDHPDVQEALQEKLDLLLVDEFQDTSPLQLALFVKLSQLARRTYWVGDIKQAIYGFRGGDARLMKAVLDIVPQECREVLGDSWRSVPSLVEAVNDLFSETFSEQAGTTIDISLSPQREEHPSQISSFRWDLGRGKLEEQYDALSAGIGRLLDERYQVFDKACNVWRDVSFADIAVLARTNAHVRDIARVLNRNSIPSATVQPGLLATPEAVLVMAALRRVLDPSDTVATAEIYSLVTSCDPEEWLQHRLRYIRSGHDKSLWMETGDDAHPALQAVAGLRAHAALFSPSEALQAVTAAVGAAEHVQAWCRNSDEARIRLMNLDTLLEFARRYEEESAASWQAVSISGLLNWLADLARDELDLFAEPPVNAVRVTTYHKSKGLEWPVVILLDLDSTSDALISHPMVVSSRKLDARDPLRDRRIRFWPSPFGSAKGFAGIDAVLQSDVLQEAQTLAGEEAARLFYVAATRARDCLVFAVPSKARSFSWLASAGAECLIDVHDDAIRLPGGRSLACRRWDDLAATVPAVRPGVREEPLSWISQPTASEVFYAENISPSRITANDGVMTVVEEVVYDSDSCHIKGSVDMSVLGTAVHEVLAFALVQDDGVCTPHHIRDILARYGLSGRMDSEALYRRLRRFRAWLAMRWPEGTLHVEMPVQHVQPDRRVLKGQIDLLVAVNERWVIIDHKSMDRDIDLLRSKALDYTGQLQAYSHALEAVTSQCVEESWVHFVAAGRMVRLSSCNDQTAV